jgi:hypothetical protein
MTDRTMSNDENTTKDVWKTPFNPAVNDDKAAVKPVKKPVKVVAFEIEEADVGGDPYNHTGSFCIPEFEDD